MITRQNLQNKMNAYIDGEVFGFKQDLIALLNWKLTQPNVNEELLMKTVLLLNKITNCDKKLSMNLCCLDIELILKLYTEYPNSDELFRIESIHALLMFLEFFNDPESRAMYVDRIHQLHD